MLKSFSQYVLSSGISGIAWATPLADWIAFVISAILIVPCLGKLSKSGNGLKT